MFRRSARLVGCGNGTSLLSTGTDSPVSAVLIDPQVADFQQSQIGRHFVAGLQCHDITGHQFGGRNARAASATHDRGFVGQAAGQRRDGSQSLGFLQKTDHRVDHHHGQYHQRVDRRLEHRRHKSRGQQRVDQRLVKLQQESRQRPAPWPGREQIRTEMRLPISQRELIQAPFGIRVQQLGHFARW